MVWPASLRVAIQVRSGRQWPTAHGHRRRPRSVSVRNAARGTVQNTDRFRESGRGVALRRAQRRAIGFAGANGAMQGCFTWAVSVRIHHLPVPVRRPCVASRSWSRGHRSWSRGHGPALGFERHRRPPEARRDLTGFGQDDHHRRTKPRPHHDHRHTTFDPDSRQDSHPDPRPRRGIIDPPGRLKSSPG